jgi:hypothetical protein
MSRIAHEVSRRMTPEYAKERAREMARDRMHRAKDRAVESSWLAPLVGAGIGALAAKAVQSRAQGGRRFEQEGASYGQRRELYGYPRGEYGYPGGEYPEYASTGEYDLYGAEAGEGGDGGSGLGERAAEARDRARAKAEEVKDLARGKAEQAKGRIEEARGRVQGATASLRERIPDRERIRESAHEDMGFWALGALALGALFGMALPETQGERRMLEPARRKARELGEQAKDKAFEKSTEAMEKATQKIGSAGGEQREHPEQQPQAQQPQAGASPSTSPGGPSLH